MAFAVQLWFGNCSSPCHLKPPERSTYCKAPILKGPKRIATRIHENYIRNITRVRSCAPFHSFLSHDYCRLAGRRRADLRQALVARFRTVDLGPVADLRQLGTTRHYFHPLACIS